MTQSSTSGTANSGENIMDDLNTTSTETTAAAGIDLTAARAKLASAKAAVQEQERAIIEAELVDAQTMHAGLAAQCETAQAKFDEINQAVERQHHVFLRALTARNGSAQKIDTEQRNPPQPDWDHGGYRPGARATWQKRISECVQEQKNADAEYARETAELSRLQSDRREAAQTLENLTWQEAPTRQRVFELQRKLTALTPKTVVNVAPWTPPESAETLVLELEADDGLRTLPNAPALKIR
jgi:hypothetical protein